MCAAMQCVRVATTEWQGRSDDAVSTFRSLFAAGERTRARELLRSGLHLKEVPTAIVRLGCYSDPSWVNYQYIAAAQARLGVAADLWYFILASHALKRLRACTKPTLSKGRSLRYACHGPSPTAAGGSGWSGIGHIRRPRTRWPMSGASYVLPRPA